MQKQAKTVKTFDSVIRITIYDSICLHSSDDQMIMDLADFVAEMILAYAHKTVNDSNRRIKLHSGLK